MYMETTEQLIDSSEDTMTISIHPHDEDDDEEEEVTVERLIITTQCRLCTTVINIEESVNIFDPDKDIAEKIYLCIPLLIVPSDQFPHTICSKCFEQLDSSNSLILKSIQSEKYFKTKLEEENNRKKKIKRVKSLSSASKDKPKNYLEDPKEICIDGPVICDLCGNKKFSDMKTFDQHMEVLHNAPQLEKSDVIFTSDGNPYYICIVCQELFETFEEQNEHQQKHNDLKCKSCNQLHPTSLALQRHTCIKNLPKPVKEFHCKICRNVLFDKYEDCKRHMKQCHTNNDNDKEDGENDNDDVDVSGTIDEISCKVGQAEYEKHQCQHCQRIFHNAGNLARHSVMHMEQVVCDVCPKTFNSYINMVKHRRTHGANDGVNENNLYTCHKCKKEFYKHTDLIRHLVTHGVPRSESSPWCCRFCNKRMMTKLSLNIHERIHTGQRPYVCTYCGGKFRSKANLDQHSPIHTGVRNHKCNICGKAFSRKSFVTTHMRVHTGDRPYSCNLCEARFTQVGDMRRHLKKHDKDIFKKGQSKRKTTARININDSNISSTKETEHTTIVLNTNEEEEEEEEEEEDFEEKINIVEINMSDCDEGSLDKMLCSTEIENQELSSPSNFEDG